jgi:hypothetical protein
VHPTGGSLRVFRLFAWLEVDSGKLVLSRPAHQRVTRAVGQLKIILLIKEFVMSKKSNPSKSKKKSKGDKPDNSSALPGWPGYRTRAGRSGYDPIDTRAEAGHMAGTILQRLFTGQITNPIALFLLTVLGLILIGPIVLTISAGRAGNLFPSSAWLFALLFAIVGIALLINVIRNVGRIIRR